MFTVNNHLGTVEIEDQIGVTKSLLNTYSFIDPTKTGIWGWSYGGYVTAMTMSKDYGHVFQCGVSVAPVTAWYYYGELFLLYDVRLTTRFISLKERMSGDSDNKSIHERIREEG